MISCLYSYPDSIVNFDVRPHTVLMIIDNAKNRRYNNKYNSDETIWWTVFHCKCTYLFFNLNILCKIKNVCACVT